MADPDGDSQMHSSPSSSTSDSEMFPAAGADPSTPRGARSNGRRGGGEMSPPASQPRGSAPGDPDAMDTGAADYGDEYGEGYRCGKIIDADEEMAAALEAEEGDDESEALRKAEEEPGWAWKNPKAREEAERSLEVVLDAGFSMREFGELFEESAITKFSGMN